jgi:hypothetical protein
MVSMFTADTCIGCQVLRPVAIVGPVAIGIVCVAGAVVRAG